MTEDEAKIKWCPFARVMQTEQLKNANGMPVDAIAATSNRRSDYDYVKCIGSKCMAWRWEEVNYSPPDTCEGLQQEGNRLVRIGYCGLAGKP